MVRPKDPAAALHDALELLASRLHPHAHIRTNNGSVVLDSDNDCHETDSLDTIAVELSDGRRTLRVDLTEDAVNAVAAAIHQFLTPPAVSPAQDDPLMAARQRGEQGKRDILASQGDILSPPEVANRLAVDLEEVEQRGQDGLLLALPLDSGELGFPTWQFTEAGLLPGLEVVFQNMTVRSPWMRAQFFLTGDLRLDGRTPLEMLLRGEVDAVRRAGAAYGEQLAS